MRWLRYGGLCKALHVLPRAGGVLDQPQDEVMRLEVVLGAYARYDEHENKKSATRAKNRQRHTEVKQ